MRAASSRSFPPSMASRLDAATKPGALSPRFLSGQKSAPSALDVWEISRRFPERWSQLMRAAYGGDVGLIMLTFHVCERTARKWLAAEGGVRSQHATIAQLEFPAAYHDIILAEAA